MRPDKLLSRRARVVGPIAQDDIRPIGKHIPIKAAVLRSTAVDDEQNVRSQARHCFQHTIGITTDAMIPVIDETAVKAYPDRLHSEEVVEFSVQ